MTDEQPEYRAVRGGTLPAIKLISWSGLKVYEAFMDNDGGIGLVDDNEYSIIISKTEIDKYIEFLQLCKARVSDDH